MAKYTNVNRRDIPVWLINYPATSSGVSEDRNNMIMPPLPDPLPQGEREWIDTPCASRYYV